RVPTSNTVASALARFCRQWPLGSPALKPAQSPTRSNSAPASVINVTSPDSTQMNSSCLACQCRWLDQAPGGRRSRFTPYCVSPAASTRRTLLVADRRVRQSLRRRRHIRRVPRSGAHLVRRVHPVSRRQFSKNERLLVAVAHSKPAVPVSANNDLQRDQTRR